MRAHKPKGVVITFWLGAASEEEALKLAEKRDDKMFISSNNGDTAEDVWMVDELDGDPYELSIED